MHTITVTLSRRAALDLFGTYLRMRDLAGEDPFGGALTTEFFANLMTFLEDDVPREVTILTKPL